jgi:hypothetical protein
MASFIIVTEKAKSVEEKFQKLKHIYTKLREEHIILIRQVRTAFRLSLFKVACINIKK